MIFRHPVATALFCSILAACAAPTGEPAPQSEAAAAAPAAPAAPAPAPVATPDEQLGGLRTMCADAGPAMKARQAAKPLYDRLGKEPGIRAFVTDLLHRHKSNTVIGKYFAATDEAVFVSHVTSFLAAGTGGSETYSGRDLKTAHAGMHLSVADFLQAGSDVGAALKAVGVGEDETQEVICSLVSLSPLVLAQ